MALFGSQPQTTLEVTGMHCPKCVAKVKDALEAVDGVVKADVTLEPGSAVVTGAADPAALIAAVESAGCSAAIA